MAEYPYTNFHDFNLDWILDQIKTMLTEWASTRADWETLRQDHEALRAEWAAFQPEILAYVNTNVPPAVANKINAMVVDGSLLAILTEDTGEGSPLSDTVGAWLASHIVQETGYVLDDTLTVENAAADALAVGNKFGTVVSYSAQSKTDSEKAQARMNIDAISEDDLRVRKLVTLTWEYGNVSVSGGNSQSTSTTVIRTPRPSMVANFDTRFSYIVPSGLTLTVWTSVDGTGSFPLVNVTGNGSFNLPAGGLYRLVLQSTTTGEEMTPSQGDAMALIAGEYMTQIISNLEDRVAALETRLDALNGEN